jgi:monofunctional glycosyltransferase
MHHKEETTQPQNPPMPQSIWARMLVWLRRGMMLFFVISVASVVLFSFLPPPFTPLMVKRLFQQASDSKREMRLSKDWTSIDQISDAMQIAVLCAEDQAFLEHEGFDLKAIQKALKHNKRSKKQRGASTISQQTAKNVFLWPTRSWLRKGFEVYFTFLIEAIWSKERIIEVYLNVAEWGDGIYGAEAAAQHYFKKSAAQLTREESALLAAVLPGPLKYSVKNPTDYIRKRQRWIMGQARYWHGEVDYDAREVEEVKE